MADRNREHPEGVEAMPTLLGATAKGYRAHQKPSCPRRATRAWEFLRLRRLHRDMTHSGCHRYVTRGFPKDQSLRWGNRRYRYSTTSLARKGGHRCRKGSGVARPLGYPPVYVWRLKGPSYPHPRNRTTLAGPLKCSTITNRCASCRRCCSGGTPWPEAIVKPIMPAIPAGFPTPRSLTGVDLHWPKIPGCCAQARFHSFSMCKIDSLSGVLQSRRR